MPSKPLQMKCLLVRRVYEAKKKAVLDPGPPHLRLESWYTPLVNAYERQLAIKVLSKFECLGYLYKRQENKATYLNLNFLIFSSVTDLLLTHIPEDYIAVCEYIETCATPRRNYRR